MTAIALSFPAAGLPAACLCWTSAPPSHNAAVPSVWWPALAVPLPGFWLAASTRGSDPEMQPFGAKQAKKLGRKERETRLQYLADRFLTGNQDAFDEIAELVRDQVYSVAWRFAGNRDDALDIMQNVLVRVFRALPNWKGRCRFTTWVHRIALNASVDFFRRHGKHEANRLDPEDVKRHEEGRGSSDPFLGISADTPRHAAQRREVVRRVLTALPGLSEMQQQCFVLRHFHALPLQEIAEAAGCSEGSVKRHLFRASRRLRILLADLEPMLESGTLSPDEREC